MDIDDERLMDGIYAPNVMGYPAGAQRQASGSMSSLFEVPHEDLFPFSSREGFYEFKDEEGYFKMPLPGSVISEEMRNHFRREAK